MKHLKIFENDADNLKAAKKLAKLISKHFFEDLEEFDRIIIEHDYGDRYLFNICFTDLYKETIEDIEKFNEFFGYTKEYFHFTADNFNDQASITTYFYLTMELIYKYIDKIEVFNQSNKYNL